MSLTLDQLDYLKNTIIEREFEIDLLNAYVNKDPLISSSCTIIYGYKSIGKTFTTLKFLETLGVDFSVINCDVCLNKLSLLRKCYDIIVEKTVGNKKKKHHEIPLINSVAALISAIEVLPNIDDTHHFFVLDRFDKCFETTNELLASFSKLRESSSIKSISIIVILEGNIPNEVVTFSLPKIYFKPYKEEQLIKILQMDELSGNDLESGEELFNQFVKLIVNAFYQYTGSDLTKLYDVMHKLWPRFIEPVESGRINSNELVKLYQENIELFINENVLCNWDIIDFAIKLIEEDTNNDDKETENDLITEGGGNVHDLPTHSKFFLIASYLASYGHPKNDLHKYSKVKVVKYKQRHSSPTKSPKKKLHMTKGDIDSRMLSAAHCDLERILAILNVIYKNHSISLNHSDKENLLYIDDEIVDNEEKKEVEKSKFTLTKNIDLNSQVATLYSLGFLSKTASSDILGARVRWKCNLNWKTAARLAKSIDVPINDYLMDEFN
ncbi:unnamed protein product [Candida verbasci]|uniref:Orc1-like AAA ATPase domain-containing protein n=1 Tax=Candida verbasci TaxID=1227364 RepID=A0A9W4X843_9ASCO|nr:unnamed protein product [Candida verbasci]